MRIVADLDLCQGHGMCAEEVPEVFRVVESDDGSYSHVEIVDPELDEGLRERVERAVRSCPNRTLSIQ